MITITAGEPWDWKPPEPVRMSLWSEHLARFCTGSGCRACHGGSGPPLRLHTCSPGRLGNGDGPCPDCDPAWWGEQRPGLLDQ